MENVNATQISEGFASSEIAKEMVLGYKPPNLGAALGTCAKSGGVCDFADAARQNS